MDKECPFSFESPHIESYKRFIKEFDEKVNSWIKHFLQELQNESLIKETSNLEFVTDLNDEYEFPDSISETKYRLANKTLAKSIYLNIKENGIVLGRFKIGSIPSITKKGTFIIRGGVRAQEYCLIAQFNKSPGLYCYNNEKKSEKGIIFIPEEGFRFVFKRIRKGLIRIVLPNGKSYSITDFFNAIGFSKEEIEQEVFKCDFLKMYEINASDKEQILNEIQSIKERFKFNKNSKNLLREIANCFDIAIPFNSTEEIEGDRERSLIEALYKKIESVLIGKLGRIQLNRKISKVTDNFNEERETLNIKEDFINILKVFIAYLLGIIKEDDPFDLGNLRVFLVGDYLNQIFKLWCRRIEKGVRRKIADFDEKDRNIDTFIKIINEVNSINYIMTHFDRYIYQWFTGSPMSQLIPEDNANALEAACIGRKITFNGGGMWGGIPIGHERQPRYIHWSHYGRICPIDTPQSEDIGVTLFLTISAKVNEFGIIETPCYPVLHNQEKTTIDKNEIVWISPWEELDENICIAFPDQEDKLLEGKNVEAHMGDNEFILADPKKVKFIHVSEDGLYGIAANLIPFRKHNDSVRGTMACSFLKQTLPLKNQVTPTIKTGFEKRIPEIYPFSFWNAFDGEMAFGNELIVGYIPWFGWNFEDALVISKSASEKLTSVHEKIINVRLNRSLNDLRKKIREINKYASKIKIDLNSFDINGCLKEGTEITRDSVLLIEPISIKTKKKNVGIDFRKHYVSAYIDYKDIKGKIVKCENLTVNENESAFFRFIIRDERKAELGDKLANRHGHKGVISKILEDYKMPYFLLNNFIDNNETSCPCGETRPHKHLEILINPLSIISRMNIGQLYETINARNEIFKGLADKVDCYMPDTDGNTIKLKNPVFVGMQYIMKLDHNAIDKLHGRSRDPESYNALVEQPLKGKRFNGGQRIGEMEVWSLMAHNATEILKEFLTVKSDDLIGRNKLFKSLLSSSYNIQIENDYPEAFRTFVAFCLGLGIDIILKEDALKEDARKIIYPFRYKTFPEVIKKIEISVLDTEWFANTISNGEVKTPVESGRRYNYLYHPEGIESEQIFGPVLSYTCACSKRHRDFTVIDMKPHEKKCDICQTPLIQSNNRRWRFGHINLAVPVPNPFFLHSIHEELKEFIGLSKNQINSLMINNKIDKFNNFDLLKTFFVSAIIGSEEFSNGFHKKYPDIDLPERLHIESGKKIFNQYLQQFKAENKNSKNLLNKMVQSLNEIIKSNLISGIDLLNDMLSAHKETKTLSMINLPVIPPLLRKAFETKDGKQKPHDLNELYKNVLRANCLLKENLNYKTSDNKKEREEYIRLRKNLQVAIAQLMINDRLDVWPPNRDYTIPGYPIRHSLSTYLEGKEGLINANLLGKRVDYSGRAVIIPDPNLNINNCKLPLYLVLKIYYPLIVSLLDKSKGENQVLINKALGGDEKAVELIKQKIEKYELLKKNNVLLNRQPTLHRLSILAFEPILGEGSVIAIPPLVTAGYNADFDGDQMAVYLPVTEGAKKDISKLYASEHIWHPSDGGFALSLSQDIALGCYILFNKTKKDIKNVFETSPRRNAIVSDIENLSFGVKTLKDLVLKALESVTLEGISFSIDDLLRLSKTVMAQKENMNFSDILKKENHILYSIVESGARGSWENINYLVGSIDTVQKGSNLTFGLSVGEQLKMAKKGRENLVDTKLRTAETGTLTKYLVALGQSLFITEKDCRTLKGIEVSSRFGQSKEELVGYLYGKVLAHEFEGYKKGFRIGYKDAEKIAEQLWENKMNNILVRSPITCESKNGICQTCYGIFPARGKNLNNWDEYDFPPIDTRVGIIAAQAISEPLTQAALRKKHIAGIDIEDINSIKNFFNYEYVYGLDFTIDEFKDHDLLITLINELYKLLPEYLYLKPKSSINENIDKLNKLIKERDFYEKIKEKIVSIIFNDDEEELKELEAKTRNFRKIPKTKLLDKGILVDIQKFNRLLLEKLYPQYVPKLNIMDRVLTSLRLIEKIYSDFGISVLSTHFEVLFKGIKNIFNKLNFKKEGWIEYTSYPYAFNYLSTIDVLASAAFKNVTDSLDGLKERVLIGKYLPSIKEKEKWQRLE